MEKCYKFKPRTERLPENASLKFKLVAKFIKIDKYAKKNYKLLHRNAEMLLTTLLHNISINTAAVQTIR